MSVKFIKSIFGSVFVFAGSLCSLQSESEEVLLKKIYAHVGIQDPQSGCIEAEKAILLYPHSRTLYEAYLYALSKAGLEKKQFQVWQDYKSQFENPYKREILEVMAWGTLQASSQSSSPLIRLLAVLGAFYGQDADGVEILAKNMKDPNSLVRGAAVQLASHLRDAKLGSHVLVMITEEKNWNVRMEALKASGEMKLKEAQPLLVRIISNEHTSEEEKGVAIRSIVKMYDSVSQSELEHLANNSKAAMRLLASHVIEHLDLTSQGDLLAKLLKDRHPEVRSAALHAVGVLEVMLQDDNRIKQLCIENLRDTHPLVAITAAWTLLPYSPNQASDIFAQFILQNDNEIARMASGALSATGSKGISLMQELFHKSQDPYVKLNLAMGLLQQNQDIDMACTSLYNCMINNNDKWMGDESGYFKFIAPSNIKHDDLSPNYPEAVNQATRLEILNCLAIKKYPKAQEAIRFFLQQKTVGISGMAAALLLTEGDEASLALVENLLNDSDQKNRLQAALVLAIWGGGEKALSTLYEGYKTSDRSVKEKILEGLARIGESSSIPFLVEKLQEPYPSLRIIAAVALLACLNH